MPEIELFRWWIPDPTTKRGERLTRWRMTAEEAAKHQAIRPDPASREVRTIDGDGFNHGVSGTKPAGYRKAGQS